MIVSQKAASTLPDHAREMAAHAYRAWGSRQGVQAGRGNFARIVLVDASS
jgi:hypothetical protein